MRKYIIILLMAAAALMVGCKKTGEMAQPKGPVEFVTDVPEGAMLFNVRLDGTKSHFADNASTTSGERADLVWDSSDDLGVYAIHIVDGDFDIVNAKCGLANIKSINDDGSAVFYCAEQDENWWMAEGDTDDESIYMFVAYYPANGVKRPFEEVAKLSEKEGDFSYLYSPLFPIPVQQDGKSWTTSQILMDFEIETPYTRSGLLAKETMVSFSNFTPVTTLFQFRLIAGDGVNHSGIDKITLSLRTREKTSAGSGSASFWNTDNEQVVIEYPAQYYYEVDYQSYSDFIMGLAGNGVLSVFIFGDFDNMGVVPIDGAYLEENKDEGEFYSLDMTKSNTISLVFDAPVTIPASIGDAETYFAVSAPILDGYVWDQTYSDGVILFEAYSGDEVVLVAEKAIPVDGFRPGYRYNFNLAMGQYMELTDTDAGSYTDIVELTQ